MNIDIKQLFEEKLEELVNVQKLGDSNAVKEVLKSVRQHPGSLTRTEIMYVEKSGDGYSIITHAEGKPFYIKHYNMVDGKLELKSTVNINL